MDAQRRKAYALRCRGTVKLDYQTRCRCGFDGESAPVAPELERLEAAKEKIETAVERFFAQDRVRERVQEWLDGGHEVNESTQAYVRGNRPLPEVRNLALFDRHMAGVETVARLDPRQLLEPLAGKIWEPRDLVAELARRLEGLKSERIRIETGEAPPVQDVLLPWAVRQCLNHGVTLPPGLGRAARARSAELLRPEWVSAAALAGLDGLGLGEAAETRIVGWLLDGTLPAPSGLEICPLTVAVLEVLQPSASSEPAALGRLAAALYRQHGRLAAVAGERWLARLEALAQTALSLPLPDIGSLLQQDGDEIEWLVIDALGLPLLELLKSRAERWLPHWRTEKLEYARVVSPTNTDTFFAGLLQRGVNRPLEKINALDRLLHERSLPFADLERLADAEIRATARGINSRLDPARSLRVFADHGFRLSRDGRSYVHGGKSTLERVVPVLFMVPI